MIELYNTILYEPIFNLLIWFYNIIPGHDIGLAIITLTFVVKIVLLPLSWQGIKSQKAMQDIQPKLDALKKKHKDDKAALSAETMKLYKEQKVNPLSSCLPLLIQFPFLIAVYQAFRHGLNSDSLDMLYDFVKNPGQLNSVSFGFMDLAIPSLWLSVITGAAQYVQTKMLSTKKPKTKDKGAKDEAMLAGMNKSMMYFMPLITIVIGATLPAGLVLYWFVTTILTILQQKILFRKKKNNSEGEILPPSDAQAPVKQ